MEAASGSQSHVVCYEALRGGALGRPVAPEQRRGLVVLLHRGLWAWARSLSRAPGPVRPLALGKPLAGPAPQVLVHLLADLTLAPTWRA